jgi:hypothetical protein
MSLASITQPKMRRHWAMPSPDTFGIPPIRRLLRRHLVGRDVVVDPFSRNACLATHTNDLNPTTAARWHMHAPEFCGMLLEQGVVADAVLFDPPYSPRQVAECYQQVGRVVDRAATQSAALYRQTKDALAALIRPDGIAISFGWNSTGFGKGRGFILLEVLLVAHGGAHNDTIVTVEWKAVPA